MATPAMAQEAPTLLNPVGATCVSSPFGPRAGQMHRGIDLPAPAGAWEGANGLLVELRHADGTRTRYAHLGTVTPELAGGRRTLALGERIGRVGRTGTTRGTHLHFELWRQGQPVNPAESLQLPPCDGK